MSDKEKYLPDLRDSTYSAPPTPASKPTTEEELARLASIARQPFPTDPDEQEKHILVTVRPNDDIGTYTNRRGVGYAIMLEKLAQESDDPEYKRKIYTDLSRFAIITRKRETPPQKEQQGPRELHLHQHTHNEIPDLRHVPDEELAKLAEALNARVAKAKEDPRTQMSDAERRVYDRIVPRIEENNVIDVEATETEEGEETSDESTDAEREIF